MKELPITIGNEPDKTATDSVRTFPHTIHFLFQKGARFWPIAHTRGDFVLAEADRSQYRVFMTRMVAWFREGDWR